MRVSRLIKELRFHLGLASGSVGVTAGAAGGVGAITGAATTGAIGGGGAATTAATAGEGAASCAGGTGGTSSVDSSELLSDSELSELELELLARGDIIRGVGDGGRIEATLGGLKIKARS